MTLRSRVSALLAGFAALLVALGAASLWALHRVADDMGAVQHRRLNPLVQLDAVGRALERQRASVMATLAATNDVMVEALEKQIAADATGMPRAIAALRASTGEPAEVLAYDAFAAALAKSRDDGLKEIVERLRKGQFIEADVASQSRYRPQVDAASRALDNLIGLQVSLARRDHEAANGLVSTLTAILIVAALAGLALGVAAVAGLGRAVQRVLGADERRLAEGASRVARGELVHRFTLSAGDRSSVAANLNTMSHTFSELVGDATGSAKRVAAAAGRLSEASRELAARTSGQAASLEETAASMQQLASTVQQNRERAQRAHALAEGASQVATRGSESVAEVAATMQEITAASRQIGEIVGVIDSISFQTNILALNAAIEAARAGQEGRAFAVVAAEVRALAQRTAAAARQIRDLSQDSMRRTQAGATIAAAAEATMEDIRSSVGHLSGLVDEIAHASSEQAAGVLEVNRAVEQLDIVTQNNASLAERADADAQDLTDQAAALEISVTRFIKEDVAPAADKIDLVDVPLPIALARRSAAGGREARSALKLVQGAANP